MITIIQVLEKGLFYRGMIQDFENLEFLSQIDTILNKFSEFEMFVFYF